MAGKRETIGFSAPIPRLAVGLSLAAGLLAIPQAFLIADVVAGVVSPSFAPTTGLAAGPALVLIGAILLLRAAADAGSALIAAEASADFRLGLRMDWLGRAVEEAALRDAPADEPFAGYLTFAAALGRRLGELHAVLARPSDDPAFAPERAQASDARAWADSLRAKANP